MTCFSTVWCTDWRVQDELKPSIEVYPGVLLPLLPYWVFPVLLAITIQDVLQLPDLEALAQQPLPLGSLIWYNHSSSPLDFQQQHPAAPAAAPEPAALAAAAAGSDGNSQVQQGPERTCGAHNAALQVVPDAAGPVQDLCAHVSRQLLVVSGVIGLVSGLQFTVQVITDRDFRGEFAAETTSDLRRALAVRAAYLTR